MRWGEDQKGLTLVDTLIGIFIIGVALAAAMSGLRYSGNISTVQDQRAKANTILYYVAEDIFARQYSDVSVGASLSSDYNTGGTRIPYSLSELPNGTISVTVTEPDGAGTGLKRIDVNVAWSGPLKNGETERIKFFMAEE